jgi:nucleotidyltransferase substrate binding protein (TIGR01987 family)
VAAVNERVTEAGRALATLREVVIGDDGRVVTRDAMLLRFAYTAEIMWKAQRDVLRTIDKMEGGSPKKTVRDARAAGYLDDADAEKAIELLDARNLIVHAYKEQLAIELQSVIRAMLPVLERWHSALVKAVDPRT